MVKTKTNWKIITFVVLVIILLILVVKFNFVGWVGAIVGEVGVQFKVGCMTNARPQIVSSPAASQDLNEGESLLWQFQFHDSDNDALTVSVNPDLGFAKSQSQVGSETYVDLSLDFDESIIGSYLVVVTADDSQSCANTVSYTTDLDIVSPVVPGGGAYCVPSIICDSCIDSRQRCDDGCGKVFWRPCVSEEGCKIDDDCPVDYICDDGICVFTGECLTSRDCGEEYWCVDYVCELKPVEEKPVEIDEEIEEEEKLPAKGYGLRFKPIEIAWDLISWPPKNLIAPLVAKITEQGPFISFFVVVAILLFLLLLVLLIRRKRKEKAKEETLPPPSE